MKKLLVLSLFTFHSSLFTLCIAQTGTWTALAHQAPDPANGCMLLLTDGTVIVSSYAGTGNGNVWDKLTPDATGSYVNGTWTRIASMNTDRFAFSSQVLPSGKVYVAGGEYSGNNSFPLNIAGEVYDPVANTWTVTGPIQSNWSLSDAPSELLYNGNVLEGPEIGANGGQPCMSIEQWSPTTLDYTTENNEPQDHDEAAWIKLPDSTVLTIGMPWYGFPSTDSSCRFQPKTNTWLVDNMTTNNLYDQYGEESGPGFLLPNKKAIFFGATQHNAIYTPSGNSKTKGTWAAAADFPKISGSYVGMPDAPGTIMVNGHILLAVSPIGTASNEFNSPTYFLEYDYTTNTFTKVTATIPTIGADTFATCISQNEGLLQLPDGNVLMCNNAYSNNPTQYWVYTPGSAAIPQGKPTINNIIPVTCTEYKITGKLFNGISEANGFGDDVQNATNYPLVRLTSTSGNVYYAKTTNWNRIGAVATDSLEDTAYFTIPTMPSGTYSLVVVANGFASNPTLFDVFGASLSSQTNIRCHGSSDGSASITAAGGATPYTYSWSPGGGTTSSISNVSAGTYTITVSDDGGCAVSASVVITQPAALSVSLARTNITCNGDMNGKLSSTLSGGTSPYTYSWSGGGGTKTSISNLSAGTYTLTVSDSCGNTATASTTITQPTPLVVTTDSMDVSGNCNGQATVIASGGTPAYLYNWTPGGQSTATITGLCPGNYCVTVEDKNGCTTTTCVDVVTGIENIESVTEQITIYPNPANGNFTITFNYQVVSGTQIEIYNVLGEKVYSQFNIQNPTFNINLTSQPNGIYFYRIIKDDGILSGEGKLIIQK